MPRRDGLCPKCGLREKHKKASYCWPCAKEYDLEYTAKNQDKLKIKSKKFYRENLEYETERRIKRLYGVSLKQLAEMKEEQQYRCALCGEEKKLVIDHCHTSGKVRKLLCRDCNLALGLFKENEETLLNAIQYLKDFNTTNAGV